MGVVSHRIKALIWRSIFWNRKYYYGVYFNNDSALLRLIKNVLYPRRIVKKFFYGQILPLPAGLGRVTPVTFPRDYPEADALVRDLRARGIVFLPGRYRGLAQTLVQQYGLTPDQYAPARTYVMLPASVNDRLIFDFLTDPFLLTILAKYYRGQPYVRFANAGDKICPAIFSIAYPDASFEDIKKKKADADYKTRWHYDTGSQMTFHLLLNDLTEQDTHMLYSRGNHRKYWNKLTSLDYHHSEEFARDHFDIVPLVGATGTLAIFDPNAPHRFHPVKNSCRIQLHVNFTPGNDLPERYFGGLADRSWLSGLSPLQRRAVEHIR